MNIENLKQVVVFDDCMKRLACKPPSSFLHEHLEKPRTEPGLLGHAHPSVVTASFAAKKNAGYPQIPAARWYGAGVQSTPK